MIKTEDSQKNINVSKRLPRSVVKTAVINTNVSALKENINFIFENILTKDDTIKIINSGINTKKCTVNTSSDITNSDIAMIDGKKSHIDCSDIKDDDFKFIIKVIKLPILSSRFYLFYF